MFKQSMAGLLIAAGASPALAHAGALRLLPRDDPAVITEWNTLAEGAFPASAGRHAAAHLRDDAHRDVRCGQLDRRRLHAVSRARAGVARRLGAKPRRRRRLTTCSSALLPAGTAAYDAALAARLAKIQPLRAQFGAKVGSEVARRSSSGAPTDGWATPQTFTPPALPGVWQPTPPAFAAAAFVQAGDAQALRPAHSLLLPAAPSARAQQPGIRGCRQRDQGHRRRHQHRAHRRADAAGAALGERRLQGPVERRLEPGRAFHGVAIASCR